MLAAGDGGGVGGGGAGRELDRFDSAKSGNATRNQATADGGHLLAFGNGPKAIGQCLPRVGRLE